MVIHRKAFHATRARGRNRAILAEELIHFYDLVEPFAFAVISPPIDNQQTLAPNVELSWPVQQDSPAMSVFRFRRRKTPR